MRGPERGLCTASLGGGATEGLHVDQLTGKHFTLSRVFGFFCPTNFLCFTFLVLDESIELQDTFFQLDWLVLFLLEHL